MNIDFSARPGFSSYVVLLIVAGLAMLVLAPTVRRQRPLQRFLNAAFGFGFVGYGIYLGFVFRGGHYIIFFQAFILPVVLIVRTLAGAKAAPRQMVAAPYPPTIPVQQPAWPAPTYGPVPTAPTAATAPGPDHAQDTSGWLSAPVPHGQPVIGMTAASPQVPAQTSPQPSAPHQGA